MIIFRGALEKKILQIRDLTFAWNGDFLFQNLHAEINEAKVVCLTGENGSGKTSLLKLISGMVPHFIKGEVLRGEIELFEKPVFDFPPKSFYPSIGFIPDSGIDLFFWGNFLAQELELLSSVSDFNELTFQPKLDAFCKFFPEIKSRMNEDFSAFTTDLKQLSLLLIFYLQGAKIFLLDELNFADAERLYEFYSYLKSEKKAVIFVSQQPPVKNLDEIWEISYRKIHVKCLA